MKELELKCIEIIFDKEKPQSIGTEINITANIDNSSNLEYKFIVGKGGIWTAIQEFSEKNKCVWEPNSDGNYIVMVQARQKDKTRPLDYLAKEDYSIVKREVMDFMNKKVDTDKTIQDQDDKLEINNMGNKNRENVMQNRVNDDKLKRYIDKEKDNLLFLEVAEVTQDEKRELMKEVESAREEVAVSKEVIDIDDYNLKKLKKDFENKKNYNSKEISKMDMTKEGLYMRELKENFEKEDISILKNNDKSYKRANEIIDEILVDKKQIIVGEKCSITVNTIGNESYLYRFYVKKYNQWDIIRDYDTDNTLKYTANECGEKEFLIQCKRIDSTENFDDFRVLNIQIKDMGQVEITNIQCKNSNLLVGEELNFIVDTKIKNLSNEDELIVLYKFYKISKNGKSCCIQDYSTKNDLTYIEEQKGQYKILCLVKSILSNKEYDDRAVLVYNVKPYKDIKINSFVADLNSPQASETNIKFTSEVEGGTKLLYRYKVRGPIEEDTEFIYSNEFIWNTKEPGEYEIMLFVKNNDFKGEYEDTKKIAFTIEKRGKKPIKILDVIVDKDKNTIIGDPVNIMVNAEGGTSLLYSFVVKRNNKIINELKYNKSNWIDFTPTEVGEYEIETLIKDKYSNQPYDIHTFVYLKVMEYLPGEIDYIILPYKANYLIGDTIEFECIIQNTQNILVKYETKINGHSVEKTEFSREKKLRFTPKIAGKYTIEVYAKNIKCEKEYDSKKQISIYVNEASPVINTKVIPSKKEGRVNEEFSIEVHSRGGRDVCYEFYLMEKGNWKKVQSYSKKNFYSFIPFISGRYKILALAKSYYKKINYEDYDEITFEIKDLEKWYEK